MHVLDSDLRQSITAHYSEFYVPPTAWRRTFLRVSPTLSLPMDDAVSANLAKELMTNGGYIIPIPDNERREVITNAAHQEEIHIEDNTPPGSVGNVGETIITGWRRKKRIATVTLKPIGSFALKEGYRTDRPPYIPDRP